MSNYLNQLNYLPEELAEMGVVCGQNVMIHRSVHFFGGNIHIGSNVRIDCNCVITSRDPVVIGNHVHLGIGVFIVGTAGVTLEDYVGLSARVTIFTTSDDYSGGHLTNPTVPDKYRKVTAAPVHLEKHALVGSGSVIMPGVTLHRGASVGALSFVNKSVPAYAIVTGSPLRKLGTRNQNELDRLEKEYENEVRNS